MEECGDGWFQWRNDCVKQALHEHTVEARSLEEAWRSLCEQYEEQRCAEQRAHVLRKADREAVLSLVRTEPEPKTPISSSTDQAACHQPGTQL